MTSPGSRSRSARRWGYLFAAAGNLVLLWVVNLWPGWEAVPFLTDGTTLVLPIVNASLIVGFVLNVTYVLIDQPVWRLLGQIVTTAVSIAVLVRTLQVFPFDFGDPASTWDPIVRGLLVFLIVVSAVGLLGLVVRLLRVLAGRTDVDLD